MTGGALRFARAFGTGGTACPTGIGKLRQAPRRAEARRQGRSPDPTPTGWGCDLGTLEKRRVRSASQARPGQAVPPVLPFFIELRGPKAHPDRSETVGNLPHGLCGPTSSGYHGASSKTYVALGEGTGSTGGEVCPGRCGGGRCRCIAGASARRRGRDKRKRSSRRSGRRRIFGIMQGFCARNLHGPGWRAR